VNSRATLARGVTQHVWHNTVRRGPQLRPYDSDRDNFLTMCFQGDGHYIQTFSVRYIGKKFSPGGLTPIFFLKFQFGIKGSAPEKFHPDISKTVASSEQQLSCTNRQKKQGRRCPAQTGSPTALSHVPLDRAGGT